MPCIIFSFSGFWIGSEICKYCSALAPPLPTLPDPSTRPRIIRQIARIQSYCSFGRKNSTTFWSSVVFDLGFRNMLSLSKCPLSCQEFFTCRILSVRRCGLCYWKDSHFSIFENSPLQQCDSPLPHYRAT